MKKTLVITRCPNCKKMISFNVNERDFIKWQKGEDAIICFPYLTKNQINLLTVGCCETC